MRKASRIVYYLLVAVAYFFELPVCHLESAVQTLVLERWGNG